MIKKFKNLKIVKQMEQVSPKKLKWLMFTQIQSLKKDSEYVDMICSDKSETNSDNDRLEAMVRETLVNEFSPKVKNLKSYELLVDATMHNLKKKQLQATGNQEEIA